MTTRISSTQSMANFIAQMFTTRTQIDKTQNEMTSGIKLDSPSDDPGGAGIVSQYQTTLNRLSGQKSRISYVTGYMSQEETTMSSAEDLVTRLKEIATQASNETQSSDTRKALAAEAFEIRDALVGLADTKYQGRYLYGGAADDTAPYSEVLPSGTGYVPPGTAGSTDPASKRYAYYTGTGSDQTRDVVISDSDSVRINSTGKMFQQAIGQAEILGRALEGYSTDVDANGVPTGTGTTYTFPADFHNQTAAITKTIDGLTSAAQTIVNEHTDLGGRMNRLTQASDIIDGVKSATEQARSDLQDADPFETASKLSNLQFGLQALLASGAKINNLSLMDYLS